MASNILGIGQSALAAAQAGLATTGHNIANAATPGYSRQVVIQGTAGSQNEGGGFVGKGTQVVDIQRVYSELQAGQVRTAQSSAAQLQTYYNEISRINNQLADQNAGISPVLQDFFKGVQDLAANPNLAASRQAALSDAEAMVSRFQSLDGQLREMGQAVNMQVQSSISQINVYAQQIAKLNDAIEKAMGNSEGKASNDLLDQRDYALAELSKEIKTTIVKQGNSYNVFIGNGQPLVVGAKPYTMVPTPSVTDPMRLGVGYESNGKIIPLAENSLPGGKLGGLLQYRTQTLEVAQNSLGRIAIGIAMTFNEQHKLGQDQEGNIGKDFFSFSIRDPQASTNNTGTGKIGASIADASQLTTSDYTVERLADAAGPVTVYRVTRSSDGKQSTFNSFPTTVDGVNISLTSGAPAVGDKFLIRPTADGAAEFKVLLNDVRQIAAAMPFRTSAATSNTGSGKISNTQSRTGTTLAGGTSITFTDATGMLSGFPADLPVTHTRGGTTTTYAAPATAVPYQAGDTISVGGLTFSGMADTADLTFNAGLPITLTHADGPPTTMSGFPPYLQVTVKTAAGVTSTVSAGATGTINYTPGDTLTFGDFTISGTPRGTDNFKIEANTNGLGDNRNAVLLGNLQSANTLAGKTSSYQGAYAQLVSLVGNKARELEVTSKAETRYLEQAKAAQQAESGVNLDEEATNLLRYQQAYQAAGKVMQTASQLFELLLSLGQG